MLLPSHVRRRGGIFSCSWSMTEITSGRLSVAKGEKYVTFCRGIADGSKIEPTQPMSTTLSRTALNVSWNL
jgi:hypothetical protein